MLRWIDVIKYANQGNPIPDRRVEKSEEEWEEILTPLQFQITRKKGTERPFSNQMCSIFEPGKYACVCCGTELFDSAEKFESGTGWPSFTQPLKENVIAYTKDNSHGMSRVEVTCNVCDAHLGHVFPDGPEPSGLRYCINAEAIKKVESTTKTAIIGGGCFWCTEAVFQKLKGVEKVESGYMGGSVVNPTYREVCSGRTGHAEVVKVTYNPSEVSYSDLLRIHLATHDPTQLNRQGADIGTQYRSAIFPNNSEESKIAQEVINEFNQEVYDNKVVTTIENADPFYKAEEYHQNYYNKNPEAGYCMAVINPKLKKFTQLFSDKLKEERVL